jgi:hypothetical protein
MLGDRHNSMISIRRTVYALDVSALARSSSPGTKKLSFLCGRFAQLAEVLAGALESRAFIEYEDSWDERKEKGVSGSIVSQKLQSGRFRHHESQEKMKRLLAPQRQPKLSAPSPLAP